MGHIAPDAVRKLVADKHIVGVELEDDEGEMGTCESCEYAKTTRKRVRKEREEPLAASFGDEIHSDVWGPASIETIHHRKYYASFTDDSTRWSHVKLLHGKDDTFDAYKEFEAWVDTQHHTKIKWLRSDRGGEFLSTEFTNHLKSRGTERRLTTHDTPEHNGVAESLNRRVLERVWAVLHHSSLPKFLWGEAVLHAVWLKNQTSTCALKSLTPFEALTGKKLNLLNLLE
jgi:transposase InsO family protein